MVGKLKERLTGGAKKLTGRTDLLEGIAAMCARVASVDGTIDESEVEATLNALLRHETLAAAFSSSQIEQVLNKQIDRARGGMAGRLALKREIEEAKAKATTEEMEMALMIAIDVAAMRSPTGSQNDPTPTAWTARSRCYRRPRSWGPIMPDAYLHDDAVGTKSAITVESGNGTIDIGFIRGGVGATAVRLPIAIAVRLANAILAEVKNG